MILEAGPNDLLTVEEIFRTNEAHDGVDEQRAEFASHSVGAGLDGLLINAEIRLSRECRTLPGLEIHQIGVDRTASEASHVGVRLPQQRQADAETLVGLLRPRD